MMTEPINSVLSREQIRRALAVLREEQQTNPISSTQRKSFFWYGISVAVFFGALLLFLLLVALLFPLEEGGHGWAWWILMLAAFPLIVSLFSMILLFFLNTKLICQTWREFRLAFRNKLWQLLPQACSTRRWPRHSMNRYGRMFYPSFLFCTILEPLGAFFFLRFVRKRLDMIRNTDQLVEFLTKLDISERPAGIDQVAIPTDVFKEMGDIEDVHIQRSRAMAIDEFRDSGHGYAVLKSRAMIADIAQLDEGTQLRVEARIAELASEFPPPDALRESGGVWRVPVTETPCEILCRQDEAAHRIELLSLGHSDEKSSTRRTSEAPRA